MSSSAPVTRPTDVPPAEFLASLPTARRQQEGAALLAMMDEVTGEQAVMWGPSMVGYGNDHYRYDSGREGDVFRVGFSPRASAISLYGLTHHPDAIGLLEALGPHRTGASCLYVTSLARVDQDVLRELVALGWELPVTNAR